MKDDKRATVMSVAEIRSMAAAVAAEMKSVADTAAMPPDLRQRFIAVRSSLFQRGVYDPVLVRFDSATVPKATAGDIAQQLEQVASSLQS